MTRDTELEIWRQEWRSETEPLPELKKQIKRQNRRVIAGAAILCLCLGLSTFAALRTRSSFAAGLAAGMWGSTLLLGSYAWWIRRGTWKPSAQTTRAYLELRYNRAAAKVRTLRAGSYLLAATVVLYSGLVAWDWFFSSHPSAYSAGHRLGLVIIPAMIIELLFFRWCGRRKSQEMEETRKLLDELRTQE